VGFGELGSKSGDIVGDFELEEEELGFLEEWEKTGFEIGLGEAVVCAVDADDLVVAGVGGGDQGDACGGGGGLVDVIAGETEGFEVSEKLGAEVIGTDVAN
jgi:hypothetical protein